MRRRRPSVVRNLSRRLERQEGRTAPVRGSGDRLANTGGLGQRVRIVGKWELSGLFDWVSPARLLEFFGVYQSGGSVLALEVDPKSWDGYIGSQGTGPSYVDEWRSYTGPLVASLVPWSGSFSVDMGSEAGAGEPRGLVAGEDMVMLVTFKSGVVTGDEMVMRTG